MSKRPIKKILSIEEREIVSKKLPNIDLNKYYFGKLCEKKPEEHDLFNNNTCLRQRRAGACYLCALEDSNKRNSHRDLRSNSNFEKFVDYQPSENHKLKYKEANEPEIWKDIFGIIKKLDFDKLRLKGELYQVSSWGRLRYKKPKLIDWHYLRCYIDDYVRAHIYYDIFLIHTLVAHIFNGFPEDESLIVRHLDDDGLANYPSNLRWGTQRENISDMVKNGGRNNRGWHDVELTKEEQDNEIWMKIEKSIYKTKDYYISNMGRLGWLRKDCNFIKNNLNICQLLIDRRGYLVHHWMIVHRLVANTFIQEQKTDEKYLIRHLDGNKLNNRLSNLKFGNHQENLQDSISHGRNCAYGSASGTAKLSEAEVLEIKIKLRDNVPLSAIAREYQIGRTTVRHIRDGDSWKHVQIPEGEGA